MGVHDIFRTLNIAQEMAEVYKLEMLNGDGFPRFMNDFVDMCKSRVAVPINISEYTELKDSDGKADVKGKYFRINQADGKHHYDILLKSEMNDCWHRFVKCKELFHALLDDGKDQYYSNDTLRHIEECLTDPPEASLALTSEWIAQVGEAEFLFPYKARLTHYKTDKTKDDFYKTAKLYKIPQDYIEIYLSSPYMDYFEVFSHHI